MWSFHLSFPLERLGAKPPASNRRSEVEPEESARPAPLRGGDQEQVPVEMCRDWRGIEGLISLWLAVG